MNIYKNIIRINFSIFRLYKNINVKAKRKKNENIFY